jgi:Domain of unknown function (DUF4276)
MRVEHLEFLVEEPSAEAFLNQVLPRLLGDRASFVIHAHQGKIDLLRKLNSRLRAYARWLPERMGIVVLIDRDDADCEDLKEQMERAAGEVGLVTRTTAGGGCWRVANRLAIEELEAWFFGEWLAVQQAYPRVSSTIPMQAPYRDSDNIAGGTWQAFERILKRAGYFSGGLRKMEAASAIGKHFCPARARSPSFRALQSALEEAVS